MCVIDIYFFQLLLLLINFIQKALFLDKIFPDKPKNHLSHI